MTQIRDLILEFFDLETEVSGKGTLTRLDLAARCLGEGKASVRDHDRLLEVLREGVKLLDANRSKSQATDAFVAAALTYARETGESAEHGRLYRLAWAILGANRSELTKVALRESALRLLDRARFERLTQGSGPTDAANLLALGRWARLEGKLHDAATRFEQAGGSEGEFESALTECVATKDQSALVRVLKALPEDGRTVVRRLVAYLFAVTHGQGELHHRLQNPGSIERYLVRRREDAWETIHLVDACLLTQAYTPRSPLAARIDWALAVKASGTRVATAEWQLLVLAAAAKAARRADDQGVAEFLENDYSEAASRVQPRGVFDPFQIFAKGEARAASKLPASLSLPVAILKHTLSSRHSVELDVDAETSALRAWSEILAKATPEFRGFFQKSAQFTTGLWHALGTETDNDAEKYYFNGRSMDEADTRAALAEYRHDLAAYERFEILPRAAGSLGQLHHAVLKDGLEVAVKVKFRGIERKLKADAQVLRRAADVLGAVVRNQSLSEVIESFLPLCINQCDYTQEAAAQARMHARFADDPVIRIPAVHADLSGPHVIVQERATGDSIFRFSELASAAEKNRAGEALMRWMFRSLCDGEYSYDCHPGNFLFGEDRVWVLDFGATLPVTPDNGQFIAMYRALRDQDREAFNRLMHEGGLATSPDAPELKQFFLISESILFRPFLSPKPFRFTREFLREVVMTLRKEVRAGIALPKGGAASGFRFYLSFYALLAQLGAEAAWQDVLETELTRAKGPVALGKKQTPRGA